MEKVVFFFALSVPELKERENQTHLHLSMFALIVRLFDLLLHSRSDYRGNIFETRKGKEKGKVRTRHSKRLDLEKNRLGVERELGRHGRAKGSRSSLGDRN